MKNVSILGSTGSIGTQTLDVIRRNADINVVALAAGTRVADLAEQVREFKPQLVCIGKEELVSELKTLIGDMDVKIVSGDEGLIEAATIESAEIVVTAVVGMMGITPTVEAIKAHKDIALANKETLVTAGHLIIPMAKEYGVKILPVDSEHSAIFQSMLGQDKKAVHKILLTASGGPFRGYTREQLAQVTLEDAMKHPTWNMGRKVTLDSATMFNKGLEVIEARWLFDVDYDHIEVLVQPQSLIHSMVEYEDGSVIAQIGNPDMRLPIQFALTYPHRLPSPSHEFVDWKQVGSIITEQPDVEVFRSLRLAFEAGKRGGNATTAFNAANEEAIASFIKGQLSFLSIFDVVEETLTQWTSRHIHSLSDVLEADKEARRFAKKIINRGILC